MPGRHARSAIQAAILASFGLVPCGGDAAAQARTPPAEAVRFYESGREHYMAGRYREAIADLERALVLDPGSATLAYNIARVHELLGELDEAIRYYQRYFTMLPPSEAEERQRVQETIRRLEGARRELGTGRTAREAPPLRPPPDERHAPRWVTTRGVADLAFWTVTGTGLALMAAGGILGGLAIDREAFAEQFVLGADGTLEERSALADEADRFAFGADLLLFAGAAALAGGLLLYVLRTETREVLPSEQARASVAVTPEALVVHGRWAL
ncbi:MAG: tetratricopeptide repeat protein [Myxococcota bacterium]|nr:tetratricopeptide repeat protein [Myxococcota bacterium]MDW8361465.1 tetratricopeptide repeat protein [Myxococcales bacterium]